MSKHTPGPWRIVHDGDNWLVVGPAEVGTRTIAIIPDLGEYMTEEQRTIADLLAAAPAMLAVLQELVYLKGVRGKKGKTPEYLERRKLAWTKAREILKEVEGNEKGRTSK